MKTKGQLTIIGILIVPLIILTYILVMPLINMAVEMGLNGTNSTTVQFIIQMFPIFIAFGILIMIVSYLVIVRPAE